MASTAGATTLGTAAGAGGAALRLKFIFANHDGVVVEFETEPTTLVKDLKVALMGQWPTGKQQLRKRLVVVPFIHTAAAREALWVVLESSAHMYISGMRNPALGEMGQESTLPLSLSLPCWEPRVAGHCGRAIGWYICCIDTKKIKCSARSDQHTSTHRSSEEDEKSVSLWELGKRCCSTAAAAAVSD